MIVLRALSFLMFLALAAALLLWQGQNIRADLFSTDAGARFVLLALAVLLPVAQALVVRFVPARARRIVIVLAALPALPLVSLVAGVVSLIQARGANHARTWDVALMLGAMLSVNGLLPWAVAEALVGGSTGLALAWMAIKAQFFIVVDYFLARALVHYFGSAASAFVSLRYLRKRVISLLSVFGIGVGVWVLILVNSVMTGFQTEFKQQVRGSLSHLLVKFDAGRLHVDPLDEAAQAAEWAEYVRRIEASPAIKADWDKMIESALVRLRQSGRDGDGLPDMADIARAQPAEETAPAPGAERTPRERAFLEGVRTGKDLGVPERALLIDGGEPTTPGKFYLSRVPDPEKAAAEAYHAWNSPLFRQRLQREFDDTAEVLRRHQDPRGEADVLGVSWRVSAKTLITPGQGNREPVITDLVGVDPSRETEISDLGRYVASAEIHVFRNQYVLRPILNLLGATLGWETPESLEATNAAPSFVYTEDGKGTGRLPPDLRGVLSRRGFITGSGNVRWPLFNQVRFQEYSPGARLYEKLRAAHQRATRTDDIDRMRQVAQECEREVRAILMKHLEGPDPTEPSLMAARTGCRIIFQEYLTGVGVTRTMMRNAMSSTIEMIKDRAIATDTPPAERDLLNKLWAQVNEATRPADEVTNDPAATESQREDAVAEMLKRYDALFAEAHRQAEAGRMASTELLAQLRVLVVGPDERPLTRLLAVNQAVPLAFALEKFDSGAEYTARRMEACQRALPLRTTLQADEDIDAYVKRAAEAGRRPGDGVRESGAEPGIIIGDALAESALLGSQGVRIGDVIEIGIPRVYYENGRPNASATYVKFRVTGLFRSGLYEDNMGRVYCDFDELAAILSDSEVSYYVGAKLKDYSIYEGHRAEGLKKDVDQALRKAGVSPSRVSVWEDEKKTLLEAVEREKMILGLIVSFIIVLAGVLILILVYQLVNEKVKDIGILKALGHSPWGIRSVFMFNALFIGVFGAIMGAGLGVLSSDNLNEIEDFVDRMVGIRLFPPDVYFLTYIPSVKGGALIELALNIGAPVVLFSFGCGIIPALIAARKDPVEALHYE